MFVPEDFGRPRSLTGTSASGVVFRLEPLDVGHNARDHRAWTSSIEHIRASPGFAGRTWPRMMTLGDNARDLAGQAEAFGAGKGFTYTVLDRDDDVIGCVYIYPDEDGRHDVHVRSWVRADHAELDSVLRAAVAGWLRSAWPPTQPSWLASSNQRVTRPK